MEYAAEVKWLGFRKLSKSSFIYGHYKRKTDLKLDSLSFFTLITKRQWRSPFLGGRYG